MKLKTSHLMLAPVMMMGFQPSFADDELALEEVIVTATKRAESIMDIPLSMSTFSGDLISDQAIGQLDELVTRVPNVHITGGAQTNRIAIRGMGPGNDRSFEQSVAMFIDGVYMPRSRQYRSPFFDMERIEVLRGPQAVLYGLNATAGTVLIHSRTTRAGDESELSFSAGYEMEYDGYFAEVIAGMSVGDNLGLRAAIRYSDTGDGYWYNAVTGEDENSAQEMNVRLTADWAVSDTWNITAKAAFTNADEYGNYGEQVFSEDTPPFTPGFASAVFGFYADTAFDWVRYTDNIPTDFLGRDVGLDHDITNISLNSEWEIGENTLTALLSYSKSDYVQVYNVDAMATMPGAYPGNPFGELVGQGLGNVIDEQYNQTAIEIRYASSPDRTVSYILGLYVDQNELVNSLDSFSGILLGGTAAGGLGIRGAQDQQQDADMISPYVSLTWNTTESLHLTGGIRYASQDKEYSRNNFFCENLLNEVLVPAAAFGLTPGAGGWYAFQDIAGMGFTSCGTLDGLQLDRSSSNWMPELIAQYDLSDNAVVYGKVGRSAKAGGFVFSGTLASEDLAEYDDEIATGYELGFKSTLVGGRIQFNAALFHTEFKDLQVSSFNTPPNSAPILVVSNAGQSTSKGLEMDADFAATEWLTIGASIGFLDSTYDVYEDAPCSLEEKAAGETVCSKTGKVTPYSPDYSGSVYADLAFPVGSNLEIFGGVVMSFSDSYFTEASLAASGEQDSYQKWDARIGLARTDNKWSISLVGKNLTEEAINGMGVPFAGMIGFLGAPKTVMLQGTVNF